MRQRINFGKLPEIIKVPDLISNQLQSFEEFLQYNIAPEKRTETGMQAVFKEIFPIESFDKQCVLEFISYELGIPKKKMHDCLKDGESFSVPLHVTFRLINNAAEGKGEVIEDKVFMGDFPMMSYRATFVVNGAERVIISQLHRTPGICFEKSLSTSGRTLYSFRLIPDRGSWMEVQYDNSDLIYIYLDRRRRRRKFLISTFLRSLGLETNREILEEVYGIEKLKLSQAAKIDNIEEKVLVDNVENKNGDIIAHGLEPLNLATLAELKKAGIKDVEVVDTSEMGSTFILSLQKDPSTDAEEALKEIYKKMRPGDPPSTASAKQLLKRLFFDIKHYDLGVVGRYKVNQKLGIDIDSNLRILHRDDLVAASKQLMLLHNGKGSIDDIDHLGSRRVRTVGELVQNQMRIGLVRTDRLIRERMTLFDMEAETMTPSKLVNPKALAGVIKDFFGRSQLSQFMDQTNPLAELTAKRRLSALGPGGLSRERAGFEVRDVHSSHYGRICPIETPEGPNIGLISSLAMFAKINDFGFIETPYRKVKKEIVTNEIEYLSADREEKFVIAQANAPLSEKNTFTKPYVLSRTKGDSNDELKENVSYMDVSPKQLVSPAASLIPFLEHDDANRALMGSNMQRQAVPLLQAESPLVGTGMEKVIAIDSRAVVCTKIDGIIASSTSKKIIVTKDGKLPNDEKTLAANQTYELYKFMRSNSSTCMNQKPIVKAGDKVKAGDVIADGFATDNGELALGRNLLVAFMPWHGYNFEDAIIINERLVEQDIFTSVHIAEASINARDTKLGPEEITRDVPNVGEDALRNLGPDGIIRIGAEVNQGDILVGKITPKSETELAPEERLLRAIFGDKAADVKDSSLYVSTGVSGIVMDIRTEKKFDPHKSTMTKADIKRQIKDAQNNYKTQYQEFIDDLSDKLGTILLGSKLPVSIINKDADGQPVIVPANRKITKVLLKKLAMNHDTYDLPDGPAKDQIDEVMKSFKVRLKDIKMRLDETINQLEASEGTEPGVVKSVKVYIASKRKLSVGDKMAGRHGNKGIVSNIVPKEDLPFMKDGTIVDIILNPLGVPSRMNVGQVLETHLGMAVKTLGYNAASPIFDGVTESKIHELLVEAGYDADGKAVLYDGQTGESFAQRVMVGQIYMLKLDHLVVNKLHARAVGPYSLVTQQPLGGKAQHGGQRFGEMEVWALEAYGAAYTLQEMLTVKSDDVQGRTKIYESIVRGDNTLVAGIPESFNVLMKEMQSLCLDIRVKR